MSIDPNDWLLSAGVKSAKFAQIGDTVTGMIARKPDMQQQRDPATNQPKFWDDGNPQMQMRVILQTEDRDPEDPDDTGERAIYVKSGLREAIAAAIKAAGARGLEVGGKLMVRYSGNGKAQKGLTAPKLYQAKYKAPEPGSVPAERLQTPEPAPSEIDFDAVPF